VDKVCFCSKTKRKQFISKKNNSFVSIIFLLFFSFFCALVFFRLKTSREKFNPVQVFFFERSWFDIFTPSRDSAPEDPMRRDPGVDPYGDAPPRRRTSAAGDVLARGHLQSDEDGAHPPGRG